MKRVGWLYESICDYDNLLTAFHKAVLGKGRKPDIEAFRDDLHGNIRSLQLDLKNETVHVGDYHFFRIHEPKKREICAASFRERVLHHAIMNVCEEHFDKRLIHHSYACRKGRGNHAALVTAQRFYRKSRYFLKLDIKKYFHSISHPILIRRLEQVFKDPKLITLFGAIIRSHSDTPCKGLPIGNLTSQFFANFYLGFLDRYIKETLRVKYYLRYMDDFVLFGSSRSRMTYLLEEIRVFLAQELDLILKENELIGRCNTKLKFLGFNIQEGGLTLPKEKKRAFMRKITEYEDKFITEFFTQAELQAHYWSLFSSIVPIKDIDYRNNLLSESRLTF
jgi:RNA-directed DNA polymerase